MMENAKILFKKVQDEFTADQSMVFDEWIDNSYDERNDAWGDLRIPSVGNGRYEKKHPIKNTKGETLGYFKNGAYELGYTYACVYTAGCFWIAHVGIHGTNLSATQKSYISLVDSTGNFFLSSNNKYEVVKRFPFHERWVSDIKAFKILDEGRRLFFLTDHGFSLFNTNYRKMLSNVEFEKAYLLDSWDFALSPKVKLIAIIDCIRIGVDHVTGGHLYQSRIKLYNYEGSSLVNHYPIEGNEYHQWTIQFSEDGRYLKASSESLTFTLLLISN